MQTLNKIAFQILAEHSFHMLYKISTRSFNSGVIILKDLLEEGDCIREDGQVGVSPVGDALRQHRQHRHPNTRPLVPELEKRLEVEMLPVCVLGGGDG